VPPKDFALAPRHDLTLLLFGKGCHIRRGGHGNSSTLDSLAQLGRAAVDNLARAGNTTLADIEQSRSSANWQTFNQVRSLAIPQCRQLGRHHCALAFVEMSAPEVEANDVSDRVVARIGFEPAGRPRRLAGSKPIPTIEHLVLEQHDGLVQPVRLDVGDQFIELGAVD